LETSTKQEGLAYYRHPRPLSLNAPASLLGQ